MGRGKQWILVKLKQQFTLHFSIRSALVVLLAFNPPEIFI